MVKAGTCFRLKHGSPLPITKAAQVSASSAALSFILITGHVKRAFSIATLTMRHSAKSSQPRSCKLRWEALIPNELISPLLNTTRIASTLPFLKIFFQLYAPFSRARQKVEVVQGRIAKRAANPCRA